MTAELECRTDAARFLEVAGAALAKSPVLNTVVAMVAQQTSTGEEPPAARAR